MDIRRLFVLAALALVACGSAGAPFEARPARPYAYAPHPVTLDPDGSRGGTTRPSAVPETHRACSLHRASC